MTEISMAKTLARELTEQELNLWQTRVEFYGKKWQGYKDKFANRYPSRSTVQRWKKEFERKSQCLT